MAEIHYAEGNDAAGSAACERGLQFDPYRDRLWRLLICSSRAAGDLAAAANAQRRYVDVLEELGLSPSWSGLLDVELDLGDGGALPLHGGIRIEDLNVHSRH